MMKINNLYDLSAFAAPVLGSTFKALKLIGILNYDSAIKLDNIESKQKQIYPYLPDGTPRDHKKYTYYHFQKAGRDIVLADYWIVPNSIKEVEGETYVITVRNVSANEIGIIRDQMRLLNFDFTIE